MSQWISTARRLPEPFRPVLTCRKREGEMVVEAGCLCPSGWRIVGTRVYRVDWWMPMPEPPEERDVHDRAVSPAAAQAPGEAENQPAGAQ